MKLAYKDEEMEFSKKAPLLKLKRVKSLKRSEEHSLQNYTKIFLESVTSKSYSFILKGVPLIASVIKTKLKAQARVARIIFNCMCQQR